MSRRTPRHRFAFMTPNDFNELCINNKKISIRSLSKNPILNFVAIIFKYRTYEIVQLTDMLLLNVTGDVGMSIAGGSGGNGASVSDVLLALCVNLAWAERAAEQMASEGRLRELLSRAFRHANYMLMKLVRNLSQHQVNHGLFVVRFT